MVIFISVIITDKCCYSIQDTSPALWIQNWLHQTLLALACYAITPLWRKEATATLFTYWTGTIWPILLTKPTQKGRVGSGCLEACFYDDRTWPLTKLPSSLNFTPNSEFSMEFSADNHKIRSYLRQWKHMKGVTNDATWRWTDAGAGIPFHCGDDHAQMMVQKDCHHCYASARMRNCTHWFQVKVEGTLMHLGCTDLVRKSLWPRIHKSN